MKTNLILVVDDDASLRRVMKMQLEEAGYQVVLSGWQTGARSSMKSIRIW